MAMDSRERGEPSLLRDGVGEYGEGGIGSWDEALFVGRRERCSGAGECDERRRLRDWVVRTEVSLWGVDECSSADSEESTRSLVLGDRPA